LDSVGRLSVQQLNVPSQNMRLHLLSVANKWSDVNTTIFTSLSLSLLSKSASSALRLGQFHCSPQRRVFVSLKAPMFVIDRDTLLLIFLQLVLTQVITLNMLLI